MDEPMMTRLAWNWVAAIPEQSERTSAMAELITAVERIHARHGTGRPAWLDLLRCETHPPLTERRSRPDAE